MKHKYCWGWMCATMVSLAAAGGVQAKNILYVDADAPPGGDGGGWTAPYKYLQDALDFARDPQNQIDEIHVGGGTYCPDRATSGHTPGDRAETFALVNDVGIYGGFAAWGAPIPQERDIDLYETVLTGDLLGNDVGEMHDPTMFENSFQVVTVPVETPEGARLDGFTIRNAYNVGGSWYGGGVFVYGSIVDIYNCTIKNNYALIGAGVGLETKNEASQGNLTRIVNCLIEGNEAGGSGGGVGMEHTMNLDIVNCVIVGNKAPDSGAGVHFNGGGDPDTAGWGTTVNTLIAGNELTGSYGWRTGAGVYVESEAFMEIVNSTIVQNYAGETGGFGGGLSVLGGIVNVYNSTLWANSVTTDPQIHTNENATLTVSYSDVQADDPWEGTANINEDPEFVDVSHPPAQWALNNYRLSSANSPCVNTGLNAQVPADEWDVDDDGDTSEPTPDLDLAARIQWCVVDMGAYEYPVVAGTIVAADPADGTHDARQPHPPNDSSLSARQGIGSPNNTYSPSEPIRIALSPPPSGVDLLSCWELCETGIEAVKPPTEPLDPNRIVSVTETMPGVYEILLERPISGQHWTTITYLGDGSYVSYASLPGDVNADGWFNIGDINVLPMYLTDPENPPYPPYGTYSCDIDHSGVCEPDPSLPDFWRLVDLFYGVDTYIPWYGRGLYENTCAGGGQAASGPSDGGATIEDVTGATGDPFVDYVTTVTLPDAGAEEQFRLFVRMFIDWSLDRLPRTDRAALAGRLEDPSLRFASPVAAEMIPEIVATLLGR